MGIVGARCHSVIVSELPVSKTYIRKITKTNIVDKFLKIKCYAINFYFVYNYSTWHIIKNVKKFTINRIRTNIIV